MNIIQVDHKFTNLSYNNKPVEILLHHAEAVSCTVEDINRWHKANGWAGIGYHYFVRKDGSIYKGRPDDAQGAHCPGHNATSIGICAEGSYIKEQMPEAQKKAIVELIKYLKGRYPAIKSIKRHKDCYATNCPGQNYPFDEIVSLSNNDEVVKEETVVNKPVASAPSKPQTNTTGKSEWIARLQAECNKQGFSNQKVDGYAGPNTLKGCPTLKIKAKGEITKLLQERLISLGYSCGSYGADGSFGNGTKTAVINFQKAKGLTADGIVGKNTWSKLLGL